MGYIKGQPCRYLPGHNRRIRRAGYIRVRVDGESKQQHTMIAERALGRPLPKGAEVHHVDGNKRNNAPGNLVICQDGRYHKLLHVRARIIKAGGDPATDRFCGKCRTCKPVAEFNRRRTSMVGTMPVCRECQKGYWAARRGAA